MKTTILLGLVVLCCAAFCTAQMISSLPHYDNIDHLICDPSSECLGIDACADGQASCKNAYSCRVCDCDAVCILNKS